MRSLAWALRESNGTPLQYSCLENPMDGGAWWAAVHGVTKSWTRLSDFTFTFHFPALEKEMATHSSVLAWRIAGGGAWWEAISGDAQSQTRLKWLSSSSSSSSRVGPLSNDCCPYKKRKQREGDSYEKTEPVLGVLLTQAKEGPGLPEAGRGGSPLQGSEEAWPCQHPDFRLVACRTAREHISAAVSHLVCGT